MGLLAGSPDDERNSPLSDLMSDAYLCRLDLAQKRRRCCLLDIPPTAESPPTKVDNAPPKRCESLLITAPDSRTKGG